MAPEPLNRLVRATVVSLIALREVYRSEAAFRQELLVLLLVIPAAWILTSVGVERALLIGSWMLVIVVEMVNSAIEAAVDRIGKERHDLSRKAKDFGSAAVFCSILLSAAVWILVLFPG
ncbi:MAG TPA: diacylglycerol kinase [Candidatus Binatia bacterium]